MPDDTRIEELTVEECWTLLGTVRLGRLAVNADDGVDIFPVDFLVRERTILFSSAPGTKLVDITRHPRVAFEADGIHDYRRWSVVVRGDARRLAFDEEIESSGIRGLRTLIPSEKWNYVRIDPAVVTGRRFVSARRRR